jgi:magnesium-transporting ATPase (P-type)
MLSDLHSLKGEIEMEHPNKLIESFTGTLDLEGYGKEPVQPTNILLRGTVLRNTDWIIGLVINTGHDTKIMMSNTATPSKSSGLERRSSEYIKSIVGLLVVVCFAGATGENIWNQHHLNDAWYLRWQPNVSIHAVSLILDVYCLIVGWLGVVHQVFLFFLVARNIYPSFTVCLDECYSFLPVVLHES